MTQTRLEDHLIFDVLEGGIALVSMNRPEKLNAVGPGFGDAIREAVARIRTNDAIRAVVLTGEGRAFCAGADMRALSGGDFGQHESADFPIDPEGEWPVQWFGMIVHKPVVCAINGAAVGYGAELAATCDIRIAGEAARIGWVFGKLGLVTDMGVGPIMLPHIVGLAETARLLYSSQIVDAREALRIGLVSEVVPDAELRSRAIDIARSLAAGSPLATRLLKRQVVGALYRNPHDVYFDNLKDWRSTMATDDAKEGARAFFEKRPPTWSGR